MDIKNLPLGISQVYDESKNQTQISFCYFEDSDIEYFEMEFYDENLRKWVPFDNRNGIIKK